jgi:protein TonB
MRERKTTSPWRYLLLAILLHLAVLLLPGHVYETFFPSSAPRDSGPPSDLMPDFGRFAIHIVYIENEEPQIEIVTDRAAEVVPPVVEPEYVEQMRDAEERETDDAPPALRTQPRDESASAPGAAPTQGAAVPPATGQGSSTDGTPGSGGDEGIVVVEQPKFYPAVPRLIVPPSVDDLDLADLTITLRMLVNRYGRPLEVVIVNAPEDQKVYDRVMEAALGFRFNPARRGDEPVESWIELPLNLQTTRRD